MKFKKTSAFTIFAAVLLTAVIIAGCTVNRAGAPDIDPPETVPSAEPVNEPTAEPVNEPTAAPPEAPQNILYTYGRHFTLELPADWADKWTVVNYGDSSGLHFVSRANMDAGWGGTIFNVISYGIEEWNAEGSEILSESPRPLIELGEADGIMYLLATPKILSRNSEPL